MICAVSLSSRYLAEWHTGEWVEAILAASKDDGPMGASRNASATSIAAIRIDERGLTTVNLEDGLAAADLAREALPASVACLVHHPRDGIDLRFGGIHYRHEHLPYTAANELTSVYPPGVSGNSIAHIRRGVKSGAYS